MFEQILGYSYEKLDRWGNAHIKQMRQAKVDLAHLAKKILNRCSGEDRGMDAGEKTQYAQIKAALEHVAADLAAAEKVMESDRESERGETLRRLGRSPVDGRTPAVGRSFREMFGSVQGSPDFDKPTDFLAAVHSGRHDPRLIRAGIHQEGQDPIGGFAVPEELSAQWLDSSLESEIVRPRAQIWPMTTATRKIPSFDGGDHSSALFGGLTASWLPETGEASEVAAQLQLLSLVVHKLACFTRVSNELAQDGLGFEAQLNAAMIKTIGWYLDYAFLRGTGAGMPCGVANDPALITVSKEGSQSADTINYTNLTKMFARLAPQCLQNSIWIANSTAIPQLLALSIVVGAGGSAVPVLSQENGQFSMLTRPCIFTEKLPKLGDKGDIMLVDLSQYAVGIRREILLDKSQHVGWLSDTSGYRAIMRVDGRGTWSAPIQPKEGDTLSWCITLQAR
jgi:HK97 family phage major capsid protein